MQQHYSVTSWDQKNGMVDAYFSTINFCCEEHLVRLDFTHNFRPNRVAFYVNLKLTNAPSSIGKVYHVTAVDGSTKCIEYVSGSSVYDINIGCNKNRPWELLEIYDTDVKLNDVPQRYVVPMKLISDPTICLHKIEDKDVGSPPAAFIDLGQLGNKSSQRPASLSTTALNQISDGIDVLGQLSKELIAAFPEDHKHIADDIIEKYSARHRESRNISKKI